MSDQQQPAVSLSRVLMIVVPVAIIGFVAYVFSRSWESNAKSDLANSSFTRILSSNADASTAKSTYVDKDGDLIADAPEHPKQCINPDVLVFAYIAGETESVPADGWKELLAALKQKSGKEVKYVHFDTVEEQLDALKKGELHITGLNTGVVPAAVQRDGFVPLCTFGHDDGTYGYTMQVLVPTESPIKKLTDVKGHKVVFTRPESNSGCKALLMLLKQQGLQPDEDYSWGFSTSHEESIKNVASKQYDVAPVASDILKRMEEKGEVDGKSVRSIYESDRFPPATIGYVYNLTPELRTAIRDTLLGFQLKGTGLEGRLGSDATKLVPVDYKKDWESARQIDKLAAEARSKRAG